LATYRYGFSIDFRCLLACGAERNCFWRTIKDNTAKHYYRPNHAAAEMDPWGRAARTRSVPRVSEFVLTR
jgi:hypothetical protein